MTRTRELALAVGSCALAGVSTLVASGRPWIRVVSDAGNAGAPATVALTGTVLAPVAGALGMVALAGTVVILATRGRGRRLAGAVLALTGSALAFSAAGRAFPSAPALTSAAGALGRDEMGAALVGATAWPQVALAGGLLLLASGLFTCVRGPAWPTMGSRYEAGSSSSRPGPRAGTSRGGGAGMWAALDRGEDPTA